MGYYFKNGKKYLPRNFYQIECRRPISFELVRPELLVHAVQFSEHIL